MDLFTLSKFFGNRHAIFELDVENAAIFSVGDYVSLYGDEDVIVRVGHAEDAQNARACFLSENYKRKYANCTKGNRKRELCRVTYIRDSIITVEMLYGVDVSIDKLLIEGGSESIAVVDEALSGMPLSVFAGSFYANYRYTIDGENYYLFGKNVYSDSERSFILVDVERNKYLSVTLKSMAALFPEDNDKKGNMPVIQEGEKPLTHSQDFTFSLHAVNLRLVDKTERGRASMLTEAYLGSGGEKYIGLWKKYAQAEYNKLYARNEEAGELEFDDAHNVGGTEYAFTVKNATQIYKFVEIANEYFGSKVQVTVGGKKDYAIAKGEIIEKRAVSSKEKNCIYLRTEEPIVGGKRFSGKIKLDVYGGIVQYKRRMKAIDAILSGKANNACLAMIMNGKTAGVKKPPRQVKLNQDILKEIFGEKGPNKNQYDAIEIALNTPDYAIIQGPPGTGKTRVIRAILSHFQAENGVAGDKHFLVTAYQNDATTNATDGMTDYLLGLPIFSFAGKDAEERKQQVMESWCQGIRVKVFDCRPQLESILPKREKLTQLSGAVVKLSGKCDMRSACRQLEQVLKAVDELCDEVLKSEEATAVDKYEWEKKVRAARKDVERILREWRQTLESDCLKARYYVSIIPTTAKCFEDTGGKQLAEVTEYFTVGGGNGYRSIFAEELKSLQEIASRRGVPAKEDLKTLVSVQVNMAMALGRELVPDGESIKRAVEAIEKCKEILDDVRLSEIDEILYDYAMKMSPSAELYEAIQKYGVSFSATHQKTLSKKYGFWSELDSADGGNDLPEYDDVLIDEAARSCPPDLMIPLACSKNRIVLVGDDKQLPQFLNDDTVSDMALDENEYDELLRVLHDGSLPEAPDKTEAILKVSTFEYLAKRAEELKMQDSFNRVIMLNEQYRMAPVLGRLVSKHFYGEKLLNGKDDPSEFRQDYPVIGGKNMIWLQVGSAGSAQHKGEHSYFRYAEIDAILDVLRKIRDTFIDKNKKNPDNQSKIGIIAAYKAQADRIKEELAKSEWEEIKEYIEKGMIDVGTVDSFQGKEFDVVFFSMVRTDGEFGFMSVAQDALGNSHAGAARTCVALSRAKKCMIIVGDGSVFSSKNKAKAEQKVPAIAEFYAACREGREGVCGILEGHEI